jgi:hypothetical protein
VSFAAAVAWSLLRAVVVAAIAVPMSARQEAAVRRASGTRRFWLLGALLAPLFAPDLLVGYAYARFDLSLLHRPAWNEVLYLCLVTLKFVPAGLVLRMIAPPPMNSPEALHCQRLLTVATDSRARRMEKYRSSERSLAGAVALLAGLLTFQEFEIASEMSVVAWAVHLFDSQARGLNLATLLQRSVVPGVLQVAAAGLLVVNLARWVSSERPRWNEHPTRLGLSLAGVVAKVSCVAGVVLLWGLPFLVVGVSGLGAVQSIGDNPSLVRSFVSELLVAVVLALAAGVGAAAVSRWLARRLRDGAFQRAVGRRHALPDSPSWTESGLDDHRAGRTWPVLGLMGVCLAAGTLGSLVLSALVLGAIQLPGLVAIRDTVLPLVVTLILLLIPRGLFLFLLVSPVLVRESDFVAALLAGGANSDARARRGASLVWSSGPRRTVLLAGLLSWWAFLNLTATAMLCPASISLPGTTGAIVPLPVRLYNLMHYGRNGPLSLMTLLSVLVPLVLFVLIERLLAWWWRRRF